MKSLCSFFLLSLLPSVTSSAAVLAPMPLEPAKISAAMDVLRPLLLPHVKTFTRSVVLYSWTNRSSLGLPLHGNIGFHDPAFEKYAESQGQSYFRYTPKSKDAVGNGLYLAVDPNATRSFGAKGSSWALLEVQSRPGTRFIDMTPNVNDFFDPGLVQFEPSVETAILVAGCPASSLTELLRGANDRTNDIGIDVFSSQHLPAASALTTGKAGNGRACQALREAIAHDPVLRASAVKYGYTGFAYQGCGERAYAFNVWAPLDFLDRSLSAGYASEYAAADGDIASRQRLSSFFRPEVGSSTGGFSLSLLQAQHYSFPYPEWVDAVPLADLYGYAKSHFMGCDPQYLEDNTDFSNPSGNSI